MTRKADFCLIGRNIGYTLSPKIYTELWSATGEMAGHTFGVRDLPELAPFIEEIRSGRLAPLGGFAVTSPYKVEVCSYLDEMTEDAIRSGAVNSVHITPDGRLIGHNTDLRGFSRTLPYSVGQAVMRALVCGTGGASRAVRVGLAELGIPYDIVSRGSLAGTLLPESVRAFRYEEMGSLKAYTHIINATPVGSVKIPGVLLPLPYDTARPGTVFYDFNYAPPVTPFMEAGLLRGGVAVNGLPMLRTLIFDYQWPFLRDGII